MVRAGSRRGPARDGGCVRGPADPGVGTPTALYGGTRVGPYVRLYLRMRVGPYLRAQARVCVRMRAGLCRTVLPGPSSLIGRGGDPLGVGIGIGIGVAVAAGAGHGPGHGLGPGRRDRRGRPTERVRQQLPHIPAGSTRGDPGPRTRTRRRDAGSRPRCCRPGATGCRSAVGGARWGDGPAFLPGPLCFPACRAQRLSGDIARSAAGAGAGPRAGVGGGSGGGGAVGRWRGLRSGSVGGSPGRVVRCDGRCVGCIGRCVVRPGPRPVGTDLQPSCRAKGSGVRGRPAGPAPNAPGDGGRP